MPQLAANWPDKQSNNVQPKSSLIDLETQASGQQGGSEMHRERLSEKTLSIGGVAKRCDSPNPESIIKAIELWKQDKTNKEISILVGVPERTIRRYLRKNGFKRNYDFVSKKMLGRVFTEQHKNKISITKKLKGNAKREKNPNWKGGLTNPKIQVWNTTEYKLWRESVFVRDNYICKGCGIKNEKGLGKTIELNAHHILPRRDFPHLTFDISNGITLCLTCHNKTKKKEYLSVNIWKQRV